MRHNSTSFLITLIHDLLLDISFIILACVFLFSLRLFFCYLQYCDTHFLEVCYKGTPKTKEHGHRGLQLDQKEIFIC